MTTEHDIDLVIRLRNGDISAGGHLYSRYKQNVYYFVLKMVKDEAAAEDIVQQTFMAMIEKIGMLKQNDIFRPWLFSIARNESLMLLRRKNLVPMEGLEASEESVFDEATPHSVFAQRETEELVHDAVALLTPAYREIILLQMTEQLSYDEIAVITKSTVSSVRSKLHKARIALAKKLSPMIQKERRS